MGGKLLQWTFSFVKSLCIWYCIYKDRLSNQINNLASIKYVHIVAQEEVEKGIEFCRKYGILPVFVTDIKKGYAGYGKNMLPVAC